MSNQDLLSDRARSVPANLSVSYQSEGGLHLVAGSGCYLYSSSGSAFLDCVNNVTHVGHSHPHVTQRIKVQQRSINTNSRYLNAGLNAYTRRLLRTFPAPLSSGRCFMVASGSESNDLAMRICRAHAHARRARAAAAAGSAAPAPLREREVFVCLPHAYHGATDSVIDISPYKYAARGGRGRAPYVIEVGLPESFDDDAAVDKELQQLQCSIDEAIASGRSICGFFAESVLSCAGQVWPSARFMRRIYAIVRRAGGLCVADEVQTGFGRMGSSFWAFESLGLAPDMVSMGKSIGNGHPMAALVCTAAVADSFDNGMEYFNSCAGTNTAAAVGMAVMDCIEQQHLMRQAARVGSYLLAQLRALGVGRPLIHDARGQGLFLGIELRLPSDRARPVAVRADYPSFQRPVRDATQPLVQLNQLPRVALPRCACSSSSSPQLSPTTPCSSLSPGAVCSWLCTALMLCTPLGVLVGSDGPLHNVLKIKPPLVFSERDADYFVAALRLCLAAFERLHPCCSLQPVDSALSSSSSPSASGTVAAASCRSKL